MLARSFPVTIVVLIVCGVSFSVYAQKNPEKAVNIEETSPGKRFDKGNKWAILIGVNKYLDPKISHLKYCVADVRLMEKVLVEKCGYEKRRILVISDDQKKEERQPFLINLQEQTRLWLSHVQKGDTVLVFFSGHGFLDKQGEGYLAPKNCRKDNLGLWGFRTNDLRKMLNNCQATQKLLILDCCNAGAKGTEGASSQEVGTEFTKAKGLITLASCQKNELSEEWDQKQQGLFTWFLADGLGGKADRDKDGIVDSDELYKYVSDEVPLAPSVEENQLSKARPQHPVRMIGPDVVGVFGLSRVSIRPEMELGSNEALVHFTIRNESSKSNSKPPVADAVVELLYRASSDTKPESLVQGISDKRGNVTLKTKLTAVQQIRGDFLALVTKGRESRLWRLNNFRKQGNWELTIPVSEKPAPSPMKKPALLIAPFNQQEATAKQAVWAKYLKVDVVKTNSIGMKLTLIPAGEFKMGSGKSAAEIARLFESKIEYYEDEHPQHRVQISKPFYLGTTEVTQKQWRDVMGTEPWKGKAFVKEGVDYPASNVSWEDATEYCRNLSQTEGKTYRLPTEAEWEYACRAGSTTVYSFGDDASRFGDYAWYDKNAWDIDEKYAHLVGQKKANAFGLYDMHGNVWEWCQDRYDEDYYGKSPVLDPKGPDAPASGSSRVLRGGAWDFSAQDSRSANRARNSPGLRNFNLGFRVVCDLY